MAMLEAMMAMVVAVVVTVVVEAVVVVIVVLVEPEVVPKEVVYIIISNNLYLFYIMKTIGILTKTIFTLSYY